MARGAADWHVPPGARAWPRSRGGSAPASRVPPRDWRRESPRPVEAIGSARTSSWFPADDCLCRPSTGHLLCFSAYGAPPGGTWARVRISDTHSPPPKSRIPRGYAHIPSDSRRSVEPEALRRGPEPERVLATMLVSEVVGTAGAVLRLGSHGWGEAQQAFRVSLRAEMVRHRVRHEPGAFRGSGRRHAASDRIEIAPQVVRDPVPGPAGVDSR